MVHYTLVTTPINMTTTLSTLILSLNRLVRLVVGCGMLCRRQPPLKIGAEIGGRESSEMRGYVYSSAMDTHAMTPM